MRRRLEKAPRSESHSDKPTLESVLDLWGVTYSHRTSQMIHCPLHEDRTPSCSLNLNRQLWRCHSCGEGGDAWTLIEQKEGVDFARARAIAAEQSLTKGSSGGGGGDVRGSRYGRGSQVPAGQRNRGGDRPYVPSWRRR